MLKEWKLLIPLWTIMVVLFQYIEAPIYIEFPILFAVGFCSANLIRSIKCGYDKTKIALYNWAKNRPPTGGGGPSQG